MAFLGLSAAEPVRVLVCYISIRICVHASNVYTYIYIYMCVYVYVCTYIYADIYTHRRYVCV